MIKTVGRRELPPRVIYYGPEGIGKTTFGAGAPDPIFVCTEEGADGLDVQKYDFGDGRVVGIEWPEIAAAIKAIADENHSFRSIVIDTWNYVCWLAADHVCKTQFGGRWSDPSHGFLAWGGKEGWGSTVEELRPTLRNMDKCRARGMMVVLLAHEGLTTVKDPTRGDFNRYTGDVDKRVWNLAAQWADVIGHVGYQYEVVDSRDAKGHARKGRAQGTSRRVVRFAGTAAEAAKCRVGYTLPAEIALPMEAENSFAVFMSALSGDGSEPARLAAYLEAMAAEDKNKAYKYLGTTKVKEADLFKVRELLKRLDELAVQSEDEGRDDNGA